MAMSSSLSQRLARCAGQQVHSLTLENIDGIQLKGGTILHSSRTNVKKVPRHRKGAGGSEGQQDRCVDCAGRDDTQSVNLYLSEHGVPA